jgi:RNA polymerase sigma factor (sigma-70 family)
LSAKPSIETELPTIERVIASICRRQRLNHDEQEDFASDVKLKVTERWDQICRDFQGRAKLETYLYTLAFRVLQDRRDKHWGAWAASKTARTLGPDAVRLDELIHREGRTCAEAVRILGTDPRVHKSEAELAAIASRLPGHDRGREVPLDTAPPDRAGRVAPDPLRNAEDEAEKDRLEVLLKSLLTELPQQDRLIMHLYFLERVSLARVARVLALEHKPLFRRVDKILAGFRRRLEAAGFDRETVLMLTGRAEFELRISLKKAGDQGGFEPGTGPPGTSKPTEGAQ